MARRFPARRKDLHGLRGVDGDQVASKRFVKKQQMQWTPCGAHLLLQIHTKMLNDNLESTFRQWRPSFRRAAASPPTS
jgi:hypothetical protein